MKMKYSMSLSLQYFFSYLAVLLTVMALLLAFVYNSFYQFHTRIQLDEYQNGLERICQSHENLLGDIMRLNNQIETASAAKPFYFQEEPGKAAQLIQEIERFKATSPSVHAMFLHYYGEDYIYSNFSSYRMEAYFSAASAFGTTTPKEMMYLLETISQMTLLESQTVEGYAFGVYDKPIQVVPVLLPYSYMNVQPCGTVIYLTKLDVYEKWFTSMASGTVDVYIQREGKVIAGRNVSGVPINLLLNAQGETLKYEKQTYHILRTHGAEYSCDYLMLVSDQETQVAMSGSIKLLLLISALVAAAGSLLSMRLVQSRIRPIKLLRNMISDRQPSGNELIEIRDSVQQLIDKNKDMQSRMDNLSHLERSAFARRFIIGAFQDKDEFLARAEEIHLNVDVSYFAVAILAKPAGAEYDMSLQKLMQLFQPPVDGVVYGMPAHDRVVMVLFAENEQVLMDFLETKFMGMRAVCTGMTLAVSHPHSDYQEGPHAYLEAKRAFELRFLRGNSQVIRFDPNKDSYRDYASNNQQLVEELRVALHMRDGCHVHTVLADIANAMRSIHPSLFVFRCMYNDILNVISKEAQMQGVEEKIYDLFKLSECLSLEDLDAMLHDVCTLMLAETAQDKTDDAVSQAKEIISRRFFEPDLSVSAVADEIGLSDTKLSSDFRTAYHMTPMDYIITMRMHRARRLLRDTGMLVRDIAIECGYYDISAFNRRFKSYTGMTPQQYRQQSSGVQDTPGTEI